MYDVLCFPFSAIAVRFAVGVAGGDKVVVILDNIAEQLLIGQIHFLGHRFNTIQLIAQLL